MKIALGIAQGLIFALLLTLAWRSGFWQACVYLLVVCGGSIPMVIYLRRNDPQLFERRKRGPQHEKELTQRTLHFAIMLAFFAAIVVACFDHYYAWSRAPLPAEIAGDALVAFGLLTYLVVFRENTFAGSTIDIATDQRVISSGPYAIVRHPMYVGLLAFAAGTPLALGSWWGLAFVVPTAFALSQRIFYEERVLMENLPGYAAYCERVRYRILPLVW